MNRLHVHLHVRDIAQSVRFYSTMFGAEPTKSEPDYAKWMLDNPSVNFAISTGDETGLSHLGIQVEDDAALAVATERAKDAAGTVIEEKGANCCYAVSDKVWAIDPQGVRWETFRTTGELTVYGVGANETKAAGAAKAGCCPSGLDAPKKSTAEVCCCGGGR